MFRKLFLILLLLFSFSVNAELSQVGGANSFTGLSTDTKPANLEAGSKFYETDTLSVYEYDSVTWYPTQWKGALNIHDADVHVQAVNHYVHQHDPAIATTVAVANSVNAFQLIVADTAGFSVGDSIDINTTTIEPTHPTITAIGAGAPGTLTLDRRLDKAHLVGDAVVKVVIDLSSQVGTLAAPQIYSAGPPAGIIWHITNLTLAMGHGTAGDFGIFGNVPVLTNGVILRVKISGNYGTLTNWKTNGEINVDTGEVSFHTRSTGGGTHGTAANGAFKDRTNAIMRLDGDLGDVFEVYVQDDLTTLNFWNMKIQGHREGQ